MTAPRNLSLTVLADLRITEPCPLAEDAWQPGQRTRHCAECNLDVHNFSALTAVEAAAMVTHSRETGTRLCASFEQDARGNIITTDSPGAARPGRASVFMRLLAALGLISSPFALAACTTRTGGVFRDAHDYYGKHPDENDATEPLDDKAPTSVETAAPRKDAPKSPTRLRGSVWRSPSGPAPTASNALRPANQDH